MPTISTRSTARSRRNLFRSGISRRQGSHQVAQKFTTSGRPFQSLSRCDRPSSPGSVSSGSTSGILRTGGGGAGAGSGGGAGGRGAGPGAGDSGARRGGGGGGRRKTTGAPPPRGGGG